MKFMFRTTHIYIPILVHLISRIILESRKILEFQYWSALLNNAYLSSLSRQKSQKKSKWATKRQSGYNVAKGTQKSNRDTKRPQKDKRFEKLQHPNSCFQKVTFCENLVFQIHVQSHPYIYPF